MGKAGRMAYNLQVNRNQEQSSDLEALNCSAARMRPVDNASRNGGSDSLIDVAQLGEFRDTTQTTRNTRTRLGAQSRC
jgi:hypothetical protein